MHNLHYLVTRAETPQEACNLHFIRVKADNPKDACNTVENTIEDWGTENNWRSIGGCVSSDNEVYRIVDEENKFMNSRWVPDVDMTIEKINVMCNEWLKPADYYKKQFDKCIDGKEESPFDWYGAKKHCEHMYQKGMTLNSIKHDKRETFDVLKDEFYSWSLNECGVTSLDFIGGYSGGSKLYVVYLDMHD